MYILVSPFSKTFDDKWFIYAVTKKQTLSIKIGQIVLVPIKSSLEIAVILEKDVDIKKEDYSKDKIKEIIKIINKNIFLSKYQVFLLRFIAQNYFTSIHNSARLFFPKNLREKIKKEKLKCFDLDYDINYSFNFQNKLTKLQNKVFEDIKKEKKKNILLYGITWSWKTEIYIKLIKYYLDKQKQSLFLIPEIILSNEIGDRIKKVFWKEVLVINSDITEATKTKYWCKIKSWQAKIILWTRSALFYPYINLWLIIVDEEHDNSYKSDLSPRYDVIELVNKISELENIKVLLASWTPSIKSMYLWLKWKYKVLNLLEKYK